MSLRNDLVKELVSKHPQACKLLVNVLQAIDLEKKSLSCHEEVKSLDLSELEEWTSATIDNLSVSDATPVQSDHAFRVLNGLFVDLVSNGVNFKSVNSQDEIIWTKSKIPCDYLVRWEVDMDGNTPREAAESARRMLLDPSSEAVVFDVIDCHGQVTSIDLDEEDDQAPLGLNKALEEIEVDEELKLWEVEIGLFDLENDRSTPFETHCVYVAAEKEEQARQEGLEFAENNIPVTRSVAFSPCDKANEVDKSVF